MSSASIIDRLTAALATHQPALAGRDPPFREAAVAITLVPDGEDAQVLMLRRAVHDGDPWSGHIAFPGGRSEPGDRTLLDTAIRETWEETGLDLSTAPVLGSLDEIRPRTPTLPPVIVRPFVVTMPARLEVTPSVEVAELFWVPVSMLLDPARMLRTTVAARGMQITVDAIEFEGRIIWGMTERIIRALERVFLTS